MRQGSSTRTIRRGWRSALLIVAIALVGAGCGEDPNAVGLLDQSNVSDEARAQEYMAGVDRALQSFGASQSQFGPAVQNGNKRQLQTVAIAWDEGVATLKQQNPPKDAVAAHNKLVAAVDGLSTWNGRIVRAAPNKKNVERIAKQASNSPPSKNYEAAICDLVQLGYEIVDPGVCIDGGGEAMGF